MKGIIVGTIVGLAALTPFIPSAWAIHVADAKLHNGQVFVTGNQAQPSAPISWEGVAIGITSNAGGAFHFSTSNLPPDCVGTLTVGTEAIDVVIKNCTVGLTGVPKTGQTTIYAAGDDGDLQKGIALPSPRFTDNGNGTVTDNLTGLIWLKNANCIGASYPQLDQEGVPGDGAVDWSNALNFVAGINAGIYDCSDTSGDGGTHATTGVCRTSGNS